MSVGAIIIVAIAASGVVMIAVSEAMAREHQHCLHEPDHQPFAGLASGFRHSHSPRSEVREGLPNPGERLSSIKRLHHRAYLQQQSEWVKNVLAAGVEIRCALPWLHSLTGFRRGPIVKF